MVYINLDDDADRARYTRWLRQVKQEKQRRLQEGDKPLWLRYQDDPVRFITGVLQQHRGDSWQPWRTILKAAYGKPLSPSEREFFRLVAGDREPPTKQVKELWCIIGRRAGKDSTASVIAVEAARHVDTSSLRPGEEAIVACLATSRDQAEIVWKYIRGYFTQTPRLRPWLARPITSGSILLTNDVEIRVATNNYRAPRGRPVACVILDECAFFRSEDSANPDFETYNALRPGMLTMPNSIMIGITSPHMKSGLVYKKYDEYYGEDSQEVLVVKGPTQLLNPKIEELYPGAIAKAYEEDPISAAAEYGAEFRTDLASYVTSEAVAAVMPRDLKRIEPLARTQYIAFADPSGGIRDSFAAAVAHNVGGRAAHLDAVLEVTAPFSPKDAVAQIVEFLQPYGITSLKGDRYGGDWPKAEFMEHGLVYEAVDQSKSEIYGELLPIINSRRCQLLDVPRLKAQLLQLERRSARGARDSIDHPKNGRDDVINAAAGAIVAAASDPLSIWDRLAA